MTKTVLNAFKKALENTQRELGNQNREALAIESSADELDRIQFASERDYALRNLERDSKRLREVQLALRRIQAGAYGICAGCEEDIKPKRLAAIPWAKLCIGCQGTADCEQTPEQTEELEIAA